MMITVTPDERLAAIAKARDEYDEKQADADAAHKRLMTQIGKALDEGAQLPERERRKLGPSAIGRASRYTREYIAMVRKNREQ